VEAMKDMVNAFSEYARAPDLDISVFNLYKLAHEVVDLYRTQESGIEIALNMDLTLANIEADIGRVRQMLHNLIRNSIEALENSNYKGRIEIRINKTKIQKTDVIEIVVQDNGPGFKAVSVNQVFDPYVTTKPKGTGLGLAIVKKLVEEHVGSIEAENLDDNGAVIRIKLPINEVAREAMMAMLPGRREKRRSAV